jgi:putative SOS response-associated peptidase YedK
MLNDNCTSEKSSARHGRDDDIKLKERNILNGRAELQIAGFHEGAHGVAAVEMGMLTIDLRLGSHLSPRNIPLNGSTGYAYPILETETELDWLYRRMVVILAGLAWEEFSSPQQTLSQILQFQRDDKIAAYSIVRKVMKSHLLDRNQVRQWLTEAWEKAKEILSRNNAAIVEIAEWLSEHETMDDTTLRFIVENIPDASAGDTKV